MESGPPTDGLVPTAQPAAPPPRLTHSTQAGRFRLQGQASLLRQAEHGPVLDFNFLFLT